MIKLLSKLLRLEDFEQVGHAIILKNDTSGTEELNYKLITMGELKETGICLSVPAKSFGPKHNVTLNIFDLPLSKETLKKIKNRNFKDSMQVIGKIVEIQNDETSQSVEIQFSQFNNKQWGNVLEQYVTAQSNILAYLEENEAS